MHARRRLLLALLAASAAAAPFTTGPPAAHADPLRFDVTYHDVSVEGEYAYSHTTHYEHGTGSGSTTLDAKGTFSTARPGKMGFAYDQDGNNVTFAEMMADVDLRVRTKGAYVTRSTDYISGTSRTMTCDLDPAPQEADARIARDNVRSQNSPTVTLTARAIRTLELPFVQAGNCPGGSFPAVSSDELPGLGRFDQVFELPQEAATAGKTIQLIAGPSHEPCPGADMEDTTSCSFTWKATVTFLRTRQESFGDTDGGTDDGGLVPVPGTSTTPSTTTPSGPSTPADPSRQGEAMADAVSQAIREQQAQEARSQQAMADSVSRAIQEHLQQEGADAAKVDAVSKAIREYLQQTPPTVTDRAAQMDVELPAGSTAQLSATAIAERNAKAGVKLGTAWMMDGAASVRTAAPAGGKRLHGRIAFSAADRRTIHRKRFVALTLRARVPGLAKPVTVRRVLRAPRR